MALIRYKRSNAPTGGQRYVRRDDGQTVDLLAIKDTYTVDDTMFPTLVASLDANPLVQRSGGEGPVSAPNAPSGQQVFIQSTAPAIPQGPAIWVVTDANGTPTGEIHAIQGG